MRFTIYVPPGSTRNWIENKQRNEQYLPISTDKLCNTFAKLLAPIPSDYHSEIRKFPKRVWSQGFRIRDCVPVPGIEPTCFPFVDRQ
jgi:hypothetical protein